MKPDEARRGLPVKLRGVIICVVPEHSAYVLQDTTRGVFIREEGVAPRVGELWEVEGVTDKGSFAPIVRATKKTYLGVGTLPSPVQPGWDQLVNGSLDDQLVEILGVVENAVFDPGGWSHVILRLQGGTLRVDLPALEISAEELQRCEKNLVRISGCFFAMVDVDTQRVKVGQIRIFGARIALVQQEAEDLFSAPIKTAAELMLFDPRASAFHRVKVEGQIVHVRDGEYFMMDATNGLRFVANPVQALRTGDMIEVVGFPKLTAASPVLTEALARKIGHNEMPVANRLSPDDLMSTRHDSTLVQVDGLLSSLRRTTTNIVMEMESGSWRFLAKLDAPEAAQPSLRIGSTLSLTGVYASQNSRVVPGETVVPFELLLNSPDDIRILRAAPWWTLPRLLALLGVLACVLVLAALWITQLRRKVEQRTAELGAQIKEREHAEHLRAMEQERARIAQDLHDELGSGLTEISMLAARTNSPTATAERRADHLGQMSDKGREMVAALDEIVWAMNPVHNSFSSIVSYFSLYAERFLGIAGISWKLEGPAAAQEGELDSHDRHQLFRAFKEALTNVARHSGATEVHIGIKLEDGALEVAVSDNGRGIANQSASDETHGIVGMRSRVEKLGGRFELASEAGRGTTVRFRVPVHQKP